MLQLVNYSDKAIAIFGQTINYKEDLKSLSGRFNPFLTLNGAKQPGWVFSKSKQSEVEQFISKVTNPVKTVSPRIAIIKAMQEELKRKARETFGVKLLSEPDEREIKSNSITGVFESKTETKNPAKKTVLTNAEIQFKYRELNIVVNKLNLAKLYIDEINGMQDVKCINSAISQVINHVSTDSFKRFGDKNLITMSIAKTYLRKDGKSIDVIAMEASELFNGTEITPQDVVDYIVKYPFGWPTGRTERMKLINEAYIDLTSKQLTKPLAKDILEMYNDLQRTVSSEVNNDIF